MNLLKTIRPIQPRNAKQKLLIESIEQNDLVFATGAAGSGKTLIAVSQAIKALKSGDIDKIIIGRPAVAMENLGFLPGDLKDKLDPYLLPIYDCFEFLGGPNIVHELQKNGILEIAALGFMRGRTLNNAFIILDEAQNTTVEQMRMFLTRFGENVKVVITGDLSQTDIKGENGLQWAKSTLHRCDVITFVEFTNKEVVRSSLVRTILKHIENPSNTNNEENKKYILPDSRKNTNGDILITTQ